MVRSTLKIIMNMSTLRILIVKPMIKQQRANQMLKKMKGKISNQISRKKKMIPS